MQFSDKQFVLEFLISTILIGTFSTGLVVRTIETASCTRAAEYAASSALAWNKTYGGAGSDFALALVQTVDGGYALAGSTTSFGAGTYDFWLVKTDASGNHLWNKTYGGASYDDPLAFVQTVDGGYALAGRTYSFGAGNFDFWLVKTDSSGNMLWNRTYGGTREDRAYSVVQTVDGGYALAGATYSFGAGNGDFWLVRTDAFGNHLWNRTYGGTGEDYASSMVQTSDAGYALAGGTKSFGAGSDDFWLVKTVREASTIIVPDDYSAIQEAINNAIDGDTIYVKSGVYYEHVVVNKTVSLVGEDVSTTIIDGSDTGHVVYIVQNNVSITGFTIRNSGHIHAPYLEAGICLNGTMGCVISENRIVDNGFSGISLLYSQYSRIVGNNVSGTEWGGIHMLGSSHNIVSRNAMDNTTHEYGVGINGHASSHYNTITENVISNSRYGMFYHDSRYNSICRNNISAISVEGIWLQDTVSHNVVAENSLINCTVGIFLEGPNTNNTLSGNFIAESEYGIKILNAQSNRVVNNTIADNRAGSDSWRAGIRLEGSRYSQINFNQISGNYYGVLLYSNSPYVSVYGNNISFNEFGLRVASGGSGYLNMTGNVVADNVGYGIGLTGFASSSNYAVLVNNTIVNNGQGISIGRYSDYNTVSQNYITQNDCGLYLEYSIGNLLYKNSLVSNDQQVSIQSGSVNNWNGSYPVGGNYWSDYNVLDQFSGPYQNETGSDSIGDMPYSIDAGNRDNYPLMKQYSPGHDIEITSVAPYKTVVGQGYSLNINVTTENQGDYTETFNVAIFANTTYVASQNVTLSSGSSTIIAFTWNTTGFAYSNITVWAYAEPLPDEIYTTNNNCTCIVPVHIGVPGDISSTTQGVPDGMVNMRDINYSILLFNTKPNTPKWNPNADVNNDSTVNMRDIQIAILNFNKHE